MKRYTKAKALFESLKTIANFRTTIAYKGPYSRSFALNLFQLYHNENKGRKLPTGRVTMAEINSRAF